MHLRILPFLGISNEITGNRGRGHRFSLHELRTPVAYPVPKIIESHIIKIVR